MATRAMKMLTVTVLNPASFSLFRNTDPLLNNLIVIIACTYMYNMCKLNCVCDCGFRSHQQRDFGAKCNYYINYICRGRGYSIVYM